MPQRTLEELEAEAFGEDYNPDEEEVRAQTVPVKPKGTIAGRDDTLRDTLTGLLNKPLSMVAPNERAAYDMAQRLMTIAEFNPAVGAATSAGDFYDAAKQGDKSDMAKAAFWTALNAAGIGGTAKFLKGGLREADMPWGSFDPFKPSVIEEGKALPGAPAHVEGPVSQVATAAEDYAKGQGLDLTRQTEYAKADPRRGRYIAEAYDKMKHAPDDPRVRGSYQALADETMAQWDALQKAGAKIDFIPAGMKDPYPGGPREALADLRANNHLWVFPTEGGFGSGATAVDVADNPLLASTGINVGGHDMLVNDAFRAVHDYFGHGMEGANFGARGEENAWRAHQRLFSPEALPALTSETRGQNSWVNFGPYGEANRANQRNTVFADQKTGLMPAWTTREGGMPLKYRAQQVALPAALASALALGGSTRGEDR